jgi:GTP cyclohydrolase I
MSPFFTRAVDQNGISAEEARSAVKTLLRYIGENPEREGLLETPDRVCRAWIEMTEGYGLSAEQVLSTTFEGNSDEMIVLKDIEFTSCCEHHLLTFSGRAHVAYLPAHGRIVGLSKLARIVDVYAKRLQVQERMTQQIASAIAKELAPAGVAVVIEGQHSCMCVRGVRKQGASMLTSSLQGVFRDNSATRAEFMSLISRRD